ncbi:fungal-specific transcription factor domain-containing protein [Lipomyces kononenkoae]|uniref:Fungal-specific transcription factor domain-containing protein n=1 Tax=Lipomyces kononenkoae TaxID=34357 RepID=A0ACC3SQG4_LIPKO
MQAPATASLYSAREPPPDPSVDNSSQYEGLVKPTSSMSSIVPVTAASGSELQISPPETSHQSPPTVSAPERSSSLSVSSAGTATAPSASETHSKISAGPTSAASGTTTGATTTTSTASNANRPFYTRNRRERPCDGCRRRKTRCLRPEGATICTMCVSHDEVCTFVLEPPTRRRHAVPTSNGNIALQGSGTPLQPHEAVNGLPGPQLAPAPPPLPISHPLPQNGYHPDIPPPMLDHSLAASNAVNDVRTLEDHGGILMPASKRTRINPSVGSDNEINDDQRSDSLDPDANVHSLGMNDTAYSELVGPNLLDHEYGFVHRLSTAPGERLPISKTNYLRPVSNEAVFLMTHDSEIEQDHKLVDEIEKIVFPYGPQLVALYFRIVHPSYPIIHKSYFVTQYNISPKQISPPLLAAVYSLALNWWTYDHELSHSEAPPDSFKLDTIAFTAIQRHLHRARVSTVQAGLLLLQRKPESATGGFKLGKTHISAFTAQLVGVAQALGLHLDCRGWQIPSWEIFLRRRVAWALYVQDRWVALCHGRPCYIDEKNWLVPMLDLDDFCIELSSVAGVDHGAELLIEISRLTSILSEILHTFFFAEYTKYRHEIRDPSVVFELAKPLQLKLRQWHTGLSDCLYLKPASVINNRLCTTGYLHLAYYTVEITLHRAILRVLEGCTDNVVVVQFRTAANDRANAAVNFVRSLSAEYLEAFWIHSSRDCLVEIGQFIALLEVTATSSDEAKMYLNYKEGFQWHLRVHSRAAWMFEYALLRLERIVWTTFAAVPGTADLQLMSPQQQQQQQPPQPQQPQLHQQAPQQTLYRTNPSPTSQQQQLPQHDISYVALQQHPQMPPQRHIGPMNHQHQHLPPMHVKQEPTIDIPVQPIAAVSDFWTSPASSVDDASALNGHGHAISNADTVQHHHEDHTTLRYGDVGGMLYDGGFTPIENV